MPSFPLLLQLFGIQICQIRCLAVFQEFCYINPEIFTDDDSLPDLPFQVTPQAQKPVDKDTSPTMISSSEPDHPLHLWQAHHPHNPWLLLHQDHLRQDY